MIQFRAFGHLRSAKKVAEIGTSLDVVLYRYPSRDVAELLKVTRPKDGREPTASRLSAEDVARVKLLEWTPALRSAVREVREDWVGALGRMIADRERLLLEQSPIWTGRELEARKIAIRKRLATFRVKLEQLERVRHDSGTFIHRGSLRATAGSASRSWPFEVRRHLGRGFHVCDRRISPSETGSLTILAQSCAQTDDVVRAQREADTRNDQVGRDVAQEAVGPQAVR